MSGFELSGLFQAGPSRKILGLHVSIALLMLASAAAAGMRQMV